MLYDSACDVIMGCGHPLYTDDNEQEFTKDTDGDGIPDDYEYKYAGGIDTWNDLSDGSLLGADANGDGVADEWTFIDAKEDFQALCHDPEPPARVVGLARCISTLQYSRSGDFHADPYEVPLNEGVPSLEEMTKAALSVLDNDPDGFFLMIEGGAVDWAGHGNSSGRHIEEEIDFNRSVEAVVDWVEENSGWNETLVVVTGDHETGYLTGPGSGVTPDGPVWNDLVNNGAGNVPGMEWHSGNHTNSLIPFYAKGYGSRWFNKLANETDPVRGPYLDNTELGKLILASLSLP
jgi:alkaline phosphatase